MAVTAALLGACGSGSSTKSVRDVPFTGADGKAATIGDFDGAPLVVNMWATWCKPCVHEMPAFDEVANEQTAVQIIGVNIFDTAADARAFAADLGVHYPQYTDPEGALSTALDVSGYPATAFFDADGKLLELHQGQLTADELRSSIARLYPSATTEGTTS
jgi:thiol-disulfide isomerase/thioredoxin